MKKTLIISSIIIAVIIIIYILPTKTLFSGGHTMYRIENSTVYGYSELCRKCHWEEVENITFSSAHNSTGCICHGYDPDVSSPYTAYEINIKHNLTKNIYCTNCHTRYNETGGIDTGAGVNAINQSAHYIYFNASNKTELYNRSREYFKQFE